MRLEDDDELEDDDDDELEDDELEDGDELEQLRGRVQRITEALLELAAELDKVRHTLEEL